MVRRTIINVIAEFSHTGVIPLSIIWYDGRTFPIDQVLDVTRAPALRAGGQGIRYTCKIRDTVRYIWRDVDQWFVEEEIEDEPA